MAGIGGGIWNLDEMEHWEFGEGGGGAFGIWSLMNFGVRGRLECGKDIVFVCGVLLSNYLVVSFWV